LIKKDREKQLDERKQEIRESRYSRWYRAVKTVGILKYLKTGWEKVGGRE